MKNILYKKTILCSTCLVAFSCFFVIANMSALPPSYPYSDRTVESRTQQLRCSLDELLKVKYNMPQSEFNISKNAYDEGVEIMQKGNLGVDDMETAYNLLWIGYCGDGNSEFSKQLSEMLHNNLNAFCNDEELFTGQVHEIKEKCRNAKLDWHSMSALSIASGSNFLSSISSKKANTKTGDEAIRLQKEAIFWKIVYLYGYDEQEEELGKIVRALLFITGEDKINLKRDKKRLFGCCK